MDLDPLFSSDRELADVPGARVEASVFGNRRQADGPPGQRIAKLARLELADAATRRDVIREMEGGKPAEELAGRPVNP